ncbi:thioredoxin [Hymenobacter guriensis]|uniref:Thioredoxin n=1 Tax=Hymenobacter guriensis TaxID=2793065 RepID=A0ABS0L887_9BACT|nr:thioredoxin [Hymenobacter guriensis]MBG8556281.1 thioredoxin [Hymenobacter guriensis]
MTDTPTIPLVPAEAAMLLVLLPPVGTGAPGRPAILAALKKLQRLLGTAIRVLTVDGATHPSVVRSFHATDLPCYVLMQQGVELLRACGLPEGEATVALLLSKLKS